MADDSNDFFPVFENAKNGFARLESIVDYVARTCFGDIASHPTYSAIRTVDNASARRELAKHLVREWHLAGKLVLTGYRSDGGSREIIPNLAMVDGRIVDFFDRIADLPLHPLDRLSGPAVSWRRVMGSTADVRGLCERERLHISVSTTKSTASAESNCRRWLVAEMGKSLQQPRLKGDCLREALQKFAVAERAFNRAWARAIEGKWCYRMGPPGPPQKTPHLKTRTNNSRRGFSGHALPASSLLSRNTRLSSRRSELMQINDDTPLNTKQAAEYLSSKFGPIAATTLDKLRSIGGGPQFEKFGRQVIYRPKWLNVWGDSRSSGPRASTSVDRPHAAPEVAR